ncbi:MAG: hypothetical protein D4R65_12315 [Verrucomicrobiaceae bacterium]|nr:MAG: hypothetical protein D4R65_12315 [Verrucomicrobiaceae bacterium]
MIKELIDRIAGEAGNRRLNFLLIGGHAVSKLGHSRMTLDVDFLVRSGQRREWESMMGSFGYTCYSEGNAFAQFSGKIGWPRVDLMILDDSTFGKLSAEALGSDAVKTPSARHMVALKLHAACSPDRSKPEQDWEDIRQLVMLHHLDPSDRAFRDIILRYGGKESLARIQVIWQRLIKVGG